MWVSGGPSALTLTCLPGVQGGRARAVGFTGTPSRCSFGCSALRVTQVERPLVDCRLGSHQHPRKVRK